MRRELKQVVGLLCVATSALLVRSPARSKRGSIVGLVRRGLRRTDFPLGVVIPVQGYRARNGKPIANGAKVTFANRREFSLGSSSETEGGR